MKKALDKKSRREIRSLVRLADRDIDTSDMPEVTDWNGAVVARFYRPPAQGPSWITKFLSTVADIAHRSTRSITDKSLPKEPSKSPAVSRIEYSSMPTADLVVNCLHESAEEPWFEFIRRSRPLIAAVLIRTLGRLPGKALPGLVDDLTQEVYIRLFANEYRALKSFHARNERSLFDFLTVVASNVAREYLRSSAGMHTPAVARRERLSEAVQWESALKTIQRNENDESVRALLSGPNVERDYSIFLLHYEQGFTFGEIAKVVDLAESDVERVLQDLNRLIKSRMKGSQKRGGYRFLPPRP
jgi:RNA polymerase sigma factor (sigma-70 family)